MALAMGWTRLIIQFAHRADDSAGEWRSLVGGIGTHLCCSRKGTAKHEDMDEV